MKRTTRNDRTFRTLARRAIAFVATATAVVAATIVVGAAPAAAVVSEFYVSPAGSDTTGTGSSESPWATIQHARDHVRSEGLNVAMTGDIVVNIGAGTYFQSEDIEFGPADSGSNGHEVVYRNGDDLGSARFVGGEPLTGWTHYSGNIHRTLVGQDFSTLYENGARAIAARTPNYVPSSTFPQARAPYLIAGGANESRTTLSYAAGDLDLAGEDIDDAQVHIWSGGSWSWFTDTVPISNINTSTREITLAHSTRYPIVRNGVGSRYFVQGALALLDSPGEFYFDSDTGYVYYWARDGAIGSQEIIAPTTTRLISMVGTSESDRVHDIRIEGLTLEMTDFTQWYRQGWVAAGDSGEGHTYPSYDRQINMSQHRTGLIHLENTDHVTVARSHLRNAGYSAIYMYGYGQQNTVSGNWIERVGHSGILLEGPYPGEGDILNDNLIDNNYISGVGELVGHGAGIYLMNSGGNSVTHNEISDAPRYAVAIVGVQDLPKAAIYASGNVIDHLRAHHTNQDSGDTAALYTFGISDDAPYLTNTWQQVTVSHVRAHPSMPDYAPEGVYMDNDSFGQMFSNVEVVDAAGGQFRNNDSGSHSLTNVSWSSGFTKASMDYPNIGVRPTFPWPVRPTNVTAVVSGASAVTVSWLPVQNAASYTVLRSATPGGPYSTAVCTALTATTCIDSSALGVGYYVVTSTASGSMTSALSREATAVLARADSFESGLDGWVVHAGSPTTGTTQAHSGQSSFVKNEDREVISRPISGGTGIASVWLWDDASDSTLEAMARADNSGWDNSGGWRGIGVNTPTSSTHYVTRVGTTWAATSVPRTTGWHELRWDYTSGTDVKLYIDGVLVGTHSGVSVLSQMAIGDWWADGVDGTAYFDDWRVPTVSHGFEAGVSGWTTRVGTTSTSSLEAYAGSQSLLINEDREVVSAPLAAGVERVATVWFYDDASVSSYETIARVDNSTWDGASWRAMGTRTPISTTHYVMRVNSTWTVTSVPRTSGWHELRWDYSSGAGVSMYIDGVLVGNPTGVTTFSQVAVGDWWLNGITSTAYLDAVEG